MSSNEPRVWIDPPRYWAATANMSSEQVEALLEEINATIESGRLEKLARFDFVLTENPYITWRRSRSNAA